MTNLRMFAIPLALMFSATGVSLPAESAEVTSFDISGVKLGMTIAEAHDALKTKVGAKDANFDNDYHVQPVDCSTGIAVKTSGKFAYDPNSSLVGNALNGLLSSKKTKTCIGAVGVIWGKITIIVGLDPTDGKWDDPRVSSVEYTELTPFINGTPDDDSPLRAFEANALKKFGSASVGSKYPNMVAFTWCPDGVPKETCRNAPKFKSANPTLKREQTTPDVQTPSVKTYLVIFTRQNNDKTGWYEYAGLFDNSRYVDGPQTAPKAESQPQSKSTQDPGGIPL